MARRVFFSFHFHRDAWRVAQVRNSNVVQNQYEKNTFLDAAEWEQIERNGPSAIQRWIDKQMEGTSVTIVLIGAETSTRPWVRYEIEQSLKRGNGLIGIYIHNIANQYGQRDTWAPNPFELVPIGLGTAMPLSTIVGMYDWVHNDGRINIGMWIEQAARAAGK